MVLKGARIEPKALWLMFIYLLLFLLPIQVTESNCGVNNETNSSPVNTEDELIVCIN